MNRTTQLRPDEERAPSSQMDEDRQWLSGLAPLEEDGPIYQQVRDHIAGQINRGELAPDQQLPSERELSSALGISRMTARHVYMTLQNDGLIYRTNRRGWFVSAPRLHYALMRSVSFLTNVTAEGGTPRAEVLSREMLQCPAWLRGKLDLARSVRIAAVRRRLLVGRRPAMIETIYMPSALFPGLFRHRLNRSILQLWRRHYGVEVRRAEATILGGTLPPEDAEALGIEASTAGMRLTQVMFDTDGKPFAVDVQHWRSDIAEFTVNIEFPLDSTQKRSARV